VVRLDQLIKDIQRSCHIARLIDTSDDLSLSSTHKLYCAVVTEVQVFRGRTARTVGKQRGLPTSPRLLLKTSRHDETSWHWPSAKIDTRYHYEEMIISA